MSLDSQSFDASPPARAAPAPAAVRPEVPHLSVYVTVTLLCALAGVSLLIWAWRVQPHWFELHMLPEYIFMGPRDAHLVVVVRWLAAAVGLALLLLARNLGRRAGRRPAGRLIGSCLSTAAATYLAFVTCEAIWRRHESNERVHRLATRYEAPDPTMGWQWRPSCSETVHIGGRDLLYAFNALGNRAPSKDANPDFDRPTILFTGESMSFGHALSWEETFAALVGKRLGMQVENLSGNGYGNDQAYLRLLDQLPRFKQPRAAVTFFMTGQVKRNVYDTRPRLQLTSDGSLEPRKPSSGIAALLRLAVFRARFVPFHSAEAIPLTQAILRETDRRVRARGAFPLFVIQTWGPPGRSLDQYAEGWLIRTFFEDQHLHYVVVDLQGDWRIPVDGHPDQRANEAIAGAIVQALKAAGIDGR